MNELGKLSFSHLATLYRDSTIYGRGRIILREFFIMRYSDPHVRRNAGVNAEGALRG